MCGVWIGVNVPGKWHGEKILLASVIFVLGMITTYSYIIYVPAVIAVITVSWIPALGRGRALISAAWMTGTTSLGFIFAATTLKVWPGLLFTVFNRKVTIHQGYLLVAGGTWSWQGIVMCLSLLGVAAAIATRRQILLLVILSGSCLLVPLPAGKAPDRYLPGQHLSLGIWLAAMAAGYGISYILRARVPAKLAIACGCSATLIPAIAGWDAAQWSFHGWNSSARLPQRSGKWRAGHRARSPLRTPTYPPSASLHRRVRA